MWVWVWREQTTSKVQSIQSAKTVYYHVTGCIVCVPGHDPLIFFSCPFLIGWECYDPNYLKC